MSKKKLSNCALGFPMPDHLAKALDGLLKTLPKDCTYRKASAIPDSIEVLDGERSDISKVSTNALDREYEVVLPEGIDLSWFQRNPIVTFAHKYDEMPVGRCKWIKHVPDALLAKTIYASKPDNWSGDWLPDAIFALTQQQVLRGKSIGFLPTKLRSPTPEEIKAHPSWDKAAAVIESAMLLEYAVAPVPVNQECLVEAVAKGFGSQVRRLGLEVPMIDLLLRSLEQVDSKKIADSLYNKLINH